ncbi:hypothetical protein CYLTODRAFT_351232 [Cylindrobasidium torrendii FP15055 ss-10]|uniref:Sodium/calcium exchanger membrane region domain-containing protein n=1 Tax=Cylindrobasidium torrendii FP15055 ss-10 TaxID=1314674 RepID=A0A0D7BDD1_9AGAR|nr:hypothetical protein CYLTODRAFT_351232 [Cylindrobasidium torrendii FP15055 ss-10]
MRQNTVRMRDRWVRRGKPTVGVLASLKAIMTASALNWFLIFVPLSWTAHFIQIKREEQGEQSVHAQHMMMAIVFASSFLAIMPLVRLFEYVGQQMVYYVGKHFGRFLVITLSNAVEVTLGLLLLGQCQLKLLQSTLIGVVVLNLLLIPGTSFITGGARTDHQELQTHSEDMQHTLLTIGVLSLLLPAAFFSSMRTPTHQDTGDESVPLPVNEQSRQILLHISHGIAVLLIIVYIGFMYFSRKPPGTREERRKMQRDEEEKMNGEPEINQYVGVVALTILVVLMAFTAEWLLSTIHFLEEEGHVNKEFFGIMLLPLISFSADGFVALINYCRNTFRHLFGRPIPAVKIAEAQAIDMSIQFLLLWIPFIEVIAWITNRPLLLLFDIFEVSLIVSACFLVNYVTEDSKTNWAEGLAMVAFYFMIGILAWFYKGQASVENLLFCGSVADAVAGVGTGAHH